MRRFGDWSNWLLLDAVNKSTPRSQQQGTSVKTGSVENNATLHGKITGVSSGHLIGSPLAASEVKVKFHLNWR